jgi:hypothetical protein
MLPEREQELQDLTADDGDLVLAPPQMVPGDPAGREAAAGLRGGGAGKDWRRVGLLIAGGFALLLLLNGLALWLALRPPPLPPAPPPSAPPATTAQSTPPPSSSPAPAGPPQMVLVISGMRLV